jgi:hypothetical protein
MMEVFRVGSKCFIDPDMKVEAIITAVTIREGNRALYEVVFWSGNERKELWVSAVEITGRAKEKMRIGFVPEAA